MTRGSTGLNEEFKNSVRLKHISTSQVERCCGAFRVCGTRTNHKLLKSYYPRTLNGRTTAFKRIRALPADGDEAAAREGFVYWEAANFGSFSQPTSDSADASTPVVSSQLNVHGADSRAVLQLVAHWWSISPFLERQWVLSRGPRGGRVCHRLLLFLKRVWRHRRMDSVIQQHFDALEDNSRRCHVLIGRNGERNVTMDV
ncbi:hypothetical protein C8J56DRAFT_1094719 [Mycena floridula]|nr:hypothetical protein C8J56DRAFT_1094719 [Mycena floridula]